MPDLGQIIADSPIRNVPFELWKEADAAPSKARAATATAIPPQTTYEVKRKQKGIVVWALQRGLNDAGVTPKLVEDGVFGAKTQKAVKFFQQREGLFVDGVFGQNSSKGLVKSLSKIATGVVLPEGLSPSMIEGESGNLIGAVNWSVAGGVDCSYTQRRVYDEDYGNQEVEQRAFNAVYQIGLLSRTVRNRKDTYFGKTGAKTHEKAWRLGVFHHNYPALADKIAYGGESSLSSYYTSEQAWVVAINAKFDDGFGVRTPLEWGQFYSLGSSVHSHVGRMVKYVTSWVS